MISAQLSSENVILYRSEPLLPEGFKRKILESVNNEVCVDCCNLLTWHVSWEKNPRCSSYNWNDNVNSYVGYTYRTLRYSEFLMELKVGKKRNHLCKLHCEAKIIWEPDAVQGIGGNVLSFSELAGKKRKITLRMRVHKPFSCLCYLTFKWIIKCKKYAGMCKMLLRVK